MSYLRLVTLILCALLAACSITERLKPYRIDIQQGNVVTQDAVDKLKVGMNRSQVRFVLGSPLVEDPFHANRWDYVYSFSKAGAPAEQKRFTVFFENDQLTRWEGEAQPALKPALPAEQAASAPAAKAEAAASAPKPEAAASAPQS